MEQGVFSWELFQKAPVVGILRNISPEALKELLPLYRDAGLTTLEVTMNTPGAPEMIRYINDTYGESLNVGAGTVCNLSDLESALEAGAGFIVSPLTDEQVISACVKRDIPVFPGAFTPTEIYRAWEYGASLVKIFPASSLGPEYIRELHGPFSGIKLMPTGGVNLDNCTDFLKAGASGLGVGSQLFDKQLLARGDWDRLFQHFSAFAGKLIRFNNGETI